jgi:hypothetical protein
MAHETLDLHLTRRSQDPDQARRTRHQHFADRAQALRPRLARNLRQLGAVGRVVRPPPRGSPQAVVKTRVASPQQTRHGVGTSLQHGKGRNGQDAPLFGPAVAHLEPFLAEALQDRYQFRLMVSVPEHARLDRTQYIALFMAHVEQDLGRPLDWLAAHHYDRPHLHTPIVVRGRDRNGKDLYMDKHYYEHGLRNRASRILLWFIGSHQTRQQWQQSDRQQADGWQHGGDDPDARLRRTLSVDQGQSFWQRLGALTFGGSSSASSASESQRRFFDQQQRQQRERQQRGGWGHGR